MTTKRHLIAARKKIEDPQHWSQGAMVRDKDGKPCFFTSGRAHSWCAVGAVDSLNLQDEDREKVIFALKRSLPPGHCYIGDYNDTHSHAEVLDLFTRAIEARK